MAAYDAVVEARRLEMSLPIRTLRRPIEKISAAVENLRLRGDLDLGPAPAEKTEDQQVGAWLRRAERLMTEVVTLQQGRRAEVLQNVLSQLLKALDAEDAMDLAATTKHSATPEDQAAVETAAADLAKATGTPKPRPTKGTLYGILLLHPSPEGVVEITSLPRIRNIKPLWPQREDKKHKAPLASTQPSSEAFQTGPAVFTRPLRRSKRRFFHDGIRPDGQLAVLKHRSGAAEGAERRPEPRSWTNAVSPGGRRLR